MPGSVRWWDGWQWTPATQPTGYPPSSFAPRPAGPQRWYTRTWLWVTLALVVVIGGGAAAIALVAVAAHNLNTTHVVEISVTGGGGDADVTVETDTGPSQLTVPVPWEQSYVNQTSGSYFAVSAYPTDGSSALTCSITIDGVVQSTADTSTSSFALCTASVP